MLILECPYCGVKGEETEFAGGGEAHRIAAPVPVEPIDGPHQGIGAVLIDASEQA